MTTRPKDGAVSAAPNPDQIRASIDIQRPPPGTNGDLERVREALSYIPPDDRETWVRMAFAVKSELGEAGRDIWDAWSQQAESYTASSARDVWKSASADGGVNIGTLFHEAKRHGWRELEPPPPPDPAEVAERQRQAEERKAKEAAETARQQEQAAKQAGLIWGHASDPAGNPYLDRKGVAAVETLRQIDAEAVVKILGYCPEVKGERLTGRLLVVPIKRDDKLTTLELIDGDGRKAALRGKGTKAGGYWAAQAMPADDGEGMTILIAEGTATALSAREATRHPVVAALSLSNFSKTLKALHARYPKATLMVLADVDKTTGRPDSKFFGPLKETAIGCGALLAAPDFGTNRPEGATDFNDLHQAQGLDVVREQIEGVRVQGESDAEPEDAMPPDREPLPANTIPDGWSLTRKMVFAIKEKKEETEYEPVCGHLRVTGRTTGAHGQWGLVLAFRDHDGREFTKAIAASRLHEDASILAKELSDEGLWIDPGKEKKLLSYIAAWKPDTRILSAKRLGWIEDKTGALAFVMPDRVITRDGSGQVVFQPDRFSPTIRTVHASGLLSDWQAQVAALACQHPLMRFALCAGLAPALLSFAEAGDSFTIHFWGTTSRGKTTLGQVAASPWGCAADPNDAPSLTFVRRWNLTANGLEGLAESHSDMPLVLDELGSSTVGDIRPLVYQLSGGQGKTALNSAREMKEPRSWRTIAISTGEMSIHARMADPTGDGTQSKTIKGGLTHRALDVEIDDIASGVPAEQRGDTVTGIKVACARYYGTAGPELIRLLAARFQSHADARAYVRARIAYILPRIAPAGLPAETERAVRRFALIAVAGEFASLTGLLPTTAEQVIDATREVVGRWLSVSAETDDERILASVRAFILKHEARFQRINEPESIVVGSYPRPLKDEPVRDRVGYVDRKAGRWLFTDAGLAEAAPGHDRTTIARTLKKHGHLFTNSDKMTTPITISESRPRLYVVKASIIEGCEGEKAGNLSKTGVQGVQGVRDQQPQGFEPAHLADSQGVQGVQQGVQATDTPDIAHPAHLHTGQGVQPETRAITGAAHPAHPAHPKTGDTGKNPDIVTDEEAIRV